MEQNLKCDTVKDLLPMYVDDITSETSNKLIEEHISGCADCKSVLEQMKQPVKVETAPEIRDFKKYLKRSRISIFYWIMGGGALIGIITCFIVNLAIEQRLSWFYIVAAGLLTAYLPVYVAINTRKHSLIKFLAVLNVCTFFLLGIIQIVLYYLMELGNVWFWNLGMPIALIWSAVVWASILWHMVFRTHAAITLSVLAFLCLPANYMTNVTAGYYHGIEDYYANFISNGLGNLIIAVCLLIFGIMIQLRNRKK